MPDYGSSTPIFTLPPQQVMTNTGQHSDFSSLSEMSLFTLLDVKYSQISYKNRYEYVQTLSEWARKRGNYPSAALQGYVEGVQNVWEHFIKGDWLGSIIWLVALKKKVAGEVTLRDFMQKFFDDQVQIIVNDFVRDGNVHLIFKMDEYIRVILAYDMFHETFKSSITAEYINTSHPIEDNLLAPMLMAKILDYFGYFPQAGTIYQNLFIRCNTSLDNDGMKLWDGQELLIFSKMVDSCCRSGSHQLCVGVANTMVKSIIRNGDWKGCLMMSNFIEEKYANKVSEFNRLFELRNYLYRQLKECVKDKPLSKILRCNNVTSFDD